MIVPIEDMIHDRDNCKCCRATDNMFASIAAILKTHSETNRRILEMILEVKKANERTRVQLEPLMRKN